MPAPDNFHRESYKNRVPSGAMEKRGGRKAPHSTRIEMLEKAAGEKSFDRGHRYDVVNVLTSPLQNLSCTSHGSPLQKIPRLLDPAFPLSSSYRSQPAQNPALTISLRNIPLRLH